MQNDLQSTAQYRQALDEIDLRELLSVVWQGKKIITVTTAFFAIASVIIALLLPNKYEATIIIAPVQGQPSLAGMASKLGGLASLAGINLSNDEGGEAQEALQIMQSWGFIEGFIAKNKLEAPIFAADGWNSSDNSLTYNDQLYDYKTDRWIRTPPKGKPAEPSSWELYEEFLDHLSISSDKTTGMITVGLEHYSPVHAKIWLDLYIDSVNEFMRARKLAQVNSNMKYLEAEIQITPIADMKEILYQVLEEQIKNRMLAKASPEYIFGTVSKAMIPEEPSNPQRALISILATLLGLILSSFVVIISHYSDQQTQNKN